MTIARASAPQPSGFFREEPKPIRDSDFRALVRLIDQESGIRLGPAKRQLLVGRLRKRLRALGLASFSAYRARVEEDPVERRRMLECICTHETAFFREPGQFELLEQRILPHWRAQAIAGLRPRRVRVLSVGCATGEEPYSIAMSVHRALGGLAGFRIEILATDLSRSVLERAREGSWDIKRSHEIPPALLRRYMRRGVRARSGRMAVGKELRELVHFQEMNVSAGDWHVRGPFDLIFCRNVLIYFAPSTRLGVMHRLLDQLDPDGALFLGHSESFHQISDRVRTVAPAVCQLREPEREEGVP